MTTTIRTRYATHPGSNVGDILATGGGRQHRRRIDQSQHLDDEHRAAALTLAARLGIAHPVIIGDPEVWAGVYDNETYVWTVGNGWAALVATIAPGYVATALGEETDHDGWTHDAWSCRFTHAGTGRTMRVSYRTGTGHRARRRFEQDPIPVAPDAADVMAAYLDDGYGTTDRGFEDWCADYGYDTDSRAAESTYRACQTAWQEITAWCGVDDRDRLMAGLDAARDAGEI